MLPNANNIFRSFHCNTNSSTVAVISLGETQWCTPLSSTFSEGHYFTIDLRQAYVLHTPLLGLKKQVANPPGIISDFMLCQLLKFLFLFLFLTFFSSPLYLFLLEFRLTPYEWYNPHPCLKGRCSLLINQYSLGNSFWFPVGGFMQQGSTIAPRALSTRCVSGVW